MCLKKLCATLCFLACTLPVAFAGERHSFLIDDTVSVDRADKAAEAAYPRVIKSHPVDASGFRLAVLADAVMLRWNFENVANLGTAVLEQSSNGQPFMPVSILSKDARAYTDAGLCADRQYRIRMVANDGTVVITSVLNAQGKVSAAGTAQ